MDSKMRRVRLVLWFSSLQNNDDCRAVLSTSPTPLTYSSYLKAGHRHSYHHLSSWIFTFYQRQRIFRSARPNLTQHLRSFLVPELGSITVTTPLLWSGRLKRYHRFRETELTTDHEKSSVMWSWWIGLCGASGATSSQRRRAYHRSRGEMLRDSVVVEGRMW